MSCINDRPTSVFVLLTVTCFTSVGHAQPTLAGEFLLAQSSQVLRDENGSVFMEEVPDQEGGTASGSGEPQADGGNYDNSYDFSNVGVSVNGNGKIIPLLQQDANAPSVVPFSSQTSVYRDVPYAASGWDNSPYYGSVRVPLYQAPGSAFGPTSYYEYSGAYAPDDAPGFGFTPRGTYYPYLARPLPTPIYVPRMIRPSTGLTPNTAGGLYRRSWGPGPRMTGPYVGSGRFPLRPPPSAYGWFRGPANVDNGEQSTGDLPAD